MPLISACQPLTSVPPKPEPQLSALDELQTMPDHQPFELTLNDHSLTVEVVNTPASITQGLSGRPELGRDGMLFVLGQSRIPLFWMKDMLFDLDMVWLDDNQVVDITTNVPRPQPNTPDHQLPLYQPRQPANLVLELPAGMVDQLDIQIGDQARW